MKFVKSLMISFIGAAALLVSGCTPDIKSIQDATVIACGFLPTAVQIESLFPQIGIYTTPANAVASVICQAVLTQTTPQSHRKGVRLGAADTRSVTVTLPDGRTATVSGYFVK